MIGQGTLLSGPRRGIRLAKDGNESRLDVSIEHELVKRSGVVLDESAVLEGLPGGVTVLLDALGELLELLILTHAIEIDRREALGLDQGMKETEHLINGLASIKGAARDVTGIEGVGGDRDRVLDDVDFELTALRALGSSSDIRSEFILAKLDGTETLGKVGKVSEFVTAALYQKLDGNAVDISLEGPQDLSRRIGKEQGTSRHYGSSSSSSSTSSSTSSDQSRDQDDKVDGEDDDSPQDSDGVARGGIDVEWDQQR